MECCFSNLCCVCLDERRNLKKIATAAASSNEILDKLKNCSYDVDWTRKKPDIFICEKCCINLHLAHEFIELCRENSILFNDYISQLERPIRFRNNAEDPAPVSDNAQPQTILRTVQYTRPVTNVTDSLTTQPILNPTQYISLPAPHYDQLTVESTTVSTANDGFTKLQIKTEPANVPITDEPAPVTITEQPSTNVHCEEILKLELKEEDISDSNEETAYDELSNEYVDYSHYATSHSVEEDTADHPETEVVHKCLYCNEQFAIESYLNLHMSKHTDEKPYACSVCGKQFNRKANVNVHMLIHAGVKPYHCEICPKKFTKKSHLDEHMSCHTGNKPFECNVCGNQFTRKSSLNSHMLIHAGIKSYECSICNWRFTQKAHLNRHLLTHNDLNPNNKRRKHWRHYVVQDT